MPPTLRLASTVPAGAARSIGRRVWLGGDVKVLAGVTIGDNTIIGAGSVVTKDIPSGVIAAGNPCRVLRVIGAGERTERERQELEYRK